MQSAVFLKLHIFRVLYNRRRARRESPLAISSGGKCELFVNSKPVATLDAHDNSKIRGYFDRPSATPFNGESRTTDFNKLELSLKKGENKIALKYFVSAEKQPVLLYMSFSDDPALDVAKKIAKDYPYVSDEIFRAGANRQLLPSLLSVSDNRAILKDPFPRRSNARYSPPENLKNASKKLWETRQRTPSA